MPMTVVMFLHYAHLPDYWPWFQLRRFVPVAGRLHWPPPRKLKSVPVEHKYLTLSLASAIDSGPSIMPQRLNKRRSTTWYQAYCQNCQLDAGNCLL